MLSARGLVVLGALALLVTICGCSGCKKPAALRLTYEVDVAAAYDGEKDVGKVMRQARRVVAARLDETVGSRSGTASTSGTNLVVELAALEQEDLEVVKHIVARGGRLAFDMVDDRASAQVFGAPALLSEGLPDGEGITLTTEAAPGGVEPSGRKKPPVQAPYARAACRPPGHATETTGECLARFRTWASRLRVPDDHVVGFQALTEPVSGTAVVQLEQVGWRTLYLVARPELTGADVTDATTGRDRRGSDQYYVMLTFAPAGAARFEQVTGDNVNRRFAIVLDGIVESAPVIMQRIGGGKATITMGAGDPEKQRREATQVQLTLRSGALPAPLHLASEELLGRAPR